tara:strand:+ start:330 stop:545 length:216 start_codon:yes stop_codon:yes gene_type:complete
VDEERRRRGLVWVRCGLFGIYVEARARPEINQVSEELDQQELKYEFPDSQNIELELFEVYGREWEREELLR